MLKITRSAAEVLERAYDAAAGFDPQAKVRIFRRKGEVQTGFADRPEPGDEIIEHEGMTLYVASDVGEGTLDTSTEHDRLLVREGGG